MEKVDSKEYSWEWVTADRLLSLGPCELVYAIVYGTGTYGTLYDGENTSGKVIATVQTEAAAHAPLSPKAPIYCSRGLYLDITVSDAGDGFLVQWRELGHKAG